MLGGMCGDIEFSNEGVSYISYFLIFSTGSSSDALAGVDDDEVGEVNASLP